MFPAGAARRDNHLAGTARSSQGRAAVWRGEAYPCPASTVLIFRATFDGRRSGNTFPLVGLELVLVWTAGPMTAQEHTRRLITLIFAGRNRMDMIRRELPRTKRAGWGRSLFRIEVKEGSPFRGPCAVIGSAVQQNIRVCLSRLRKFQLLFGFDSDRPDEAQ